MPRGKAMRQPNGYGTVVRLSGNRRRPFQVRVNTRIDNRGYPVYDILNYFSERTDALIALAEYNKSPYDLNAKKLSFTDVYELWFKEKYEHSKKKLSESSKACTRAAYKKLTPLHDLMFCDIRTPHLQELADKHEYSHAMLEHMVNLMKQVYKYAMKYELIEKDYAAYVHITKEDDDTHGVPFTQDEIQKLWNAAGKIPLADSILIYIYSGWRVNELLKMPITAIDLENQTFQGGLKTRASKNRMVPIHSKILPFVTHYKQQGFDCLFSLDGKKLDASWTYTRLFKQAIKAAGIHTEHTPHDCRHTFATLLNNAGANPVCVKRMLGHSSGGDITENLYTHKSIDELRKAIELI